MPKPLASLFSTMGATDESKKKYMKTNETQQIFLLGRREIEENLIFVFKLEKLGREEGEETNLFLIFTPVVAFFFSQVRIIKKYN